MIFFCKVPIRSLQTRPLRNTVSELTSLCLQCLMFLGCIVALCYLPRSEHMAMDIPVQNSWWRVPWYCNIILHHKAFCVIFSGWYFWVSTVYQDSVQNSLWNDIATYKDKFSSSYLTVVVMYWVKKLAQFWSRNIQMLVCLLNL